MTPHVFIIDTNVFVAALITTDATSPTVNILDAMFNGSLLYVLSPALLLEYRTVLIWPKLQKLHGLSESEIDQLLTEITANAIWREPAAPTPPAPDAGDSHLWALLLQANDTVLVTGDQLLLEQPPPGQSVITPAACMEVFLR